MRFLCVLCFVVACSGDDSSSGAPDAAPEYRVGPFVALLCTSGSPGDPTCPINRVDLSPLGQTASFEFIARPVAGNLDLDDIELTVGPSGLYGGQVFLQIYPGAGSLVPEIELWRSLNAPPSSTTTHVPLTLVDSGTSLGLRFTVFDPYRPAI